VCEYEQRVSTDFAMPTRLEASLRFTDHASSIGPMVSIRAALVMSGLDARLTFRKAPGAERVDPHTGIASLVSSGERLVRPPRWTRGLPGRSRLSLSVVDRDARLLAPELIADERAEATTDLEIPFAMSVNAVAWVAARGTSEDRGPVIRVNGELISTRGVMLRLAFGRSRQAMAGSDAEVAEFPLIRPGMTFYSEEKLLEAGSPANTWVSLQFVGEGGRQIGDEHFVGRCVINPVRKGDTP